ncbi:MAG: serine/threonine protein kinase, partial [Gemmatimonadales bacterium]|nr:serine/threonine protein kinase [Gemmatimonadales bacterium]
MRLRVATDGSILFGPDGNTASRGVMRVRKIPPDGIMTTVAGTGTIGFSGDGGPATSARISLIRAVLPASDGGFYPADWANNRVRRVDGNGTINTIAGTGTAGFSGDGGAARAAQLHP